MLPFDNVLLNNDEYNVHAMLQSKSVILRAQFNEQVLEDAGYLNKNHKTFLTALRYSSIIDAVGRRLTAKDDNTGFERVSCLSEDGDFEKVILNHPLQQLGVIPVTGVLYSAFLMQEAAMKDTDEYWVTLSQQGGSLIMSFGDDLFIGKSGSINAGKLGNDIGSYQYPIKELAKVLSVEGRTELLVYDTGLLIVRCTTDYATYEYLLPAQMK